MMRRLLILLLMFFISAESIFAQEESVVVKKKHNPKKATLFSTFVPGLGQAYNKKYWKIPVIYVGIGTVIYIANTNNNNYKDYRDAYNYKTGVNTDVDEDIIEIADRYTEENLISIRDDYRRNMELSWIIAAICYGLNIVDACVDAHFFEYDIGDDLSLKVEPMIQTSYAYWDTGYGNGYGSGISLKLKF